MRKLRRGMEVTSAVHLKCCQHVRPQTMAPGCFQHDLDTLLLGYPIVIDDTRHEGMMHTQCINTYGASTLEPPGGLTDNPGRGHSVHVQHPLPTGL